MIGVYIVEQYLHLHKPCGAARGCFIVGAMLWWFVDLHLPQARGFSTHRWNYFWRIFKNFTGGCLPSLSPPLSTPAGTDCPTELAVLWGLTPHCTCLHLHSLFLSQESGSCCQLLLLSAEAHVAITGRCRLQRHSAARRPGAPHPTALQRPLGFSLLLPPFLFPHLS